MATSCSPGTLVFDALAAEIRRKDRTLVLAGKGPELGFHSLESTKIGFSTSSRIYAGPSPSKTTNRSQVDCSSSPRLGVTVLKVELNLNVTL